jgi:AcrR family transcriptional regulator
MQHGGTRKTILEVSAGLFASKGYSAVSMRDIAAAVGVTVGNLYYHFADKEELVRASLTYVFSERMSPLEGLLKQHASPHDRLEAFVLWFVGEIFGEEPFTRLILRELLDGTAERLEYLAKTVFKEPFTLTTKLNVRPRHVSGFRRQPRSRQLPVRTRAAASHRRRSGGRLFRRGGSPCTETNSHHVSIRQRCKRALKWAIDRALPFLS